MADPGLIRALGLFAPIAASAGLLAWRRPDRRTVFAMMMGILWNIPAILLINVVALKSGWWSFHAQGGLFLGVPVDLLIGWAILWGAVPLLAFPRLPVLLVAALMVWLDLLLMPLLDPVLALSDRWLTGELIALLIALIPTLYFTRWTRDDYRLNYRATLQVALFAALFLWLLPTLIISMTGEVSSVLSRPLWLNFIALELLAIPAGIGLSAVQEFVQRGGGTPVPFDPPKRLVISGLYAYIANPMQLSTALLLAGLGLWLVSPWLGAAALMSVIYSAGLAAWDEGADLEERFGDSWRKYRAAVRNWIPRWHPYTPAVSRLYIAEGCDACSQLAGWLRQRNPRGLTLLAAEDHPTRDLERLTYAPGDESPDASGIVALARAFEHLNLAWALAGAIIRLPGIAPLLQLAVDSVGGGPRRIPRRSAESKP